MPGIIIAISVAAVAVNGYIGKREELAVARAKWTHTRDSLRNVLVAESLAADARNRVANDSIARLNARLTAAVSVAAAEGRRAATASATLHAILDADTTAKAALDTLEAAHARQVFSLQQAVALARAETEVERSKVADRDAQLLTLRGDLAESITRADGFERQANPGAIKRVLDSPGTHAVAALLGFAWGSR